MAARFRCALVLLLLAAGPATATDRTLPGQAPGATARVARVIDGDTVSLASGRVVRYIGIDAPEVRRRVGGTWIWDPQPFALAATRANRGLVEGRTVRLRYDKERTDRYGRALAYVYVGGVFVNAELVRRGLARARGYPPNLGRQRTLRAAEADARRAGRGMWAEDGARDPG